MLLIHHGKFPKGKSKQLITHSDHDALVHNLNVPFTKPLEINFVNFSRFLDTDYELLDAMLLQDFEIHGVSADSVDFDFLFLEMCQRLYTESLSLRITRRRPKVRRDEVQIALHIQSSLA